MITLGELFAWLLVALAIAWIWRGHGVRELALHFARQHCKARQVQLLDENVALKGWRIIADGKGRKRLARMYGFEFTVTSQERLSGTVAMFGRHLGKVELQVYLLPESADAVSAGVVDETQQRNNVIELRDWQNNRKRTDEL